MKQRRERWVWWMICFVPGSGIWVFLQEIRSQGKFLSRRVAPLEVAPPPSPCIFTFSRGTFLYILLWGISLPKITVDARLWLTCRLWAHLRTFMCSPLLVSMIVLGPSPFWLTPAKPHREKFVTKGWEQHKAALFSWAGCTMHKGTWQEKRERWNQPMLHSLGTVLWHGLCPPEQGTTFLFLQGALEGLSVTLE